MVSLLWKLPAFALVGVLVGLVLFHGGRLCLRALADLHRNYRWTGSIFWSLSGLVLMVYIGLIVGMVAWGSICQLFQCPSEYVVAFFLGMAFASWRLTIAFIRSHRHAASRPPAHSQRTKWQPPWDAQGSASETTRPSVNAPSGRVPPFIRELKLDGVVTENGVDLQRFVYEGSALIDWPLDDDAAIQVVSDFIDEAMAKTYAALMKSRVLPYSGEAIMGAIIWLRYRHLFPLPGWELLLRTHFCMLSLDPPNTRGWNAYGNAFDMFDLAFIVGGSDAKRQQTITDRIREIARD